MLHKKVVYACFSGVLKPEYISGLAGKRQGRLKGKFRYEF
jgi:hypothetical protein